MGKSGSPCKNTVSLKLPTLKVLTVGDGDLTFSLALKRAYPKISVTASTLLPSSQDLIQTYSNSREIINEFQNVWNERILFGVDATKLKTTLISALTSSRSERNGGSYNDGEKLESARDIPKYDIIMFNHPHLGDALLHESEKNHAQRHNALLCHYFHSAKELLSDNNVNGNCNSTASNDGYSINKSGRIHVCLCGTQPQTWNVIDAAKRHGLFCSVQEKTASPMQTWLMNNNSGQVKCDISEDINNNCNDDVDDRRELAMEPAQVQSHYRAPRRYRNGKLGSKHFLGKYGYRHRRTGGDLFTGSESDMMVQQSINFVFQERKEENGGNENDEIDHVQTTDNLEPCAPLPVLESLHQCDVCGMAFTSKTDLMLHLESPATPDIMIDEGRYKNTIEGTVEKIKEFNDNDGKIKKNNEAASTTHEIKPINLRNYSRNLKEEFNILSESSVPSQYDGKRLRWCCRQADFPTSKFIVSKKHCETLITSGRVYVNKSLALDSGRILTTGDVITLIDKTKDVPDLPEQSNHGVEIIRVIPTCKRNIKIVVAFKPVGVRTIGAFSSQTLEMIVTRLLGKKKSCLEILCNSITKLDTGCAGLCVLTAETREKDRISNESSSEIIMDINYEFTALLHGSVPSDWDDGVFTKIPGSGSRRWKNKRNDLNLNNTLMEDNSSYDLDCKYPSEDDNLGLPGTLMLEGDSVFIKCNERYDHSVNDQLELSSYLSTVTIKSSLDSGRLSNSLCFLFRKAGFPVVNDRFCKRELSRLPRIMRNILKNKLCIGCYSIKLLVSGIHNKTQTVNVSIEPQSRTLCSHWQNIL